MQIWGVAGEGVREGEGEEAFLFLGMEGEVPAWCPSSRSRYAWQRARVWSLSQRATRTARIIGSGAESIRSIYISTYRYGNGKGFVWVEFSGEGGGKAGLARAVREKSPNTGLSVVDHLVPLEVIWAPLRQLSAACLVNMIS